MIPAAMLSDAVAFAGPTPLDHLRVALVLALAVAQAVRGVLARPARHRHTISTRSAALASPVVPVGPTFAIWGTDLSVLHRLRALAGVAREP